MHSAGLGWRYGARVTGHPCEGLCTECDVPSSQPLTSCPTLLVCPSFGAVPLLLTRAPSHPALLPPGTCQAQRQG